MTNTAAPTATARQHTDGEDLVVYTYWTATPPLDRPTTGGWNLGPVSPRTKALAARLIKAVNAGAVHSNAVIVRDDCDHTYVRTDRNVSGKRMNADLKRIGF